MSLLSFLFIFFLFVCPSVPPFVYLVCTFLLFALCVSLNFLFLPLASSVSSPLSYICYDLFFPIFSALSLSLFLYLLSSFDPSFFPPIAAVLTLAFNWTSIDVIPPPKKKYIYFFYFDSPISKIFVGGEKATRNLCSEGKKHQFLSFLYKYICFRRCLLFCFIISQTGRFARVGSSPGENNPLQRRERERDPVSTENYVRKIGFTCIYEGLIYASMF